MQSTESRWISLSEELPPYNKPIVLLGAELDMRTSVRRRPQYAKRFQRTDGTNIFDERGITRIHETFVRNKTWTHWLILPATPTE